MLLCSSYDNSVLPKMALLAPVIQLNSKSLAKKSVESITLHALMHVQLQCSRQLPNRPNENNCLPRTARTIVRPPMSCLGFPNGDWSCTVVFPSQFATKLRRIRIICLTFSGQSASSNRSVTLLVGLPRHVEQRLNRRWRFPKTRGVGMPWCLPGGRSCRDRPK